VPLEAVVGTAGSCAPQGASLGTLRRDSFSPPSTLKPTRAAVHEMSAPATEGSATASSSDAIYERLHAWDWSSDADFQAGIGSITTPLRNAGRTEAEIGEVVRRAQVFYFGQQTGEKVTPEGYTAWLAAHGLGVPASTASGSGSLATSTHAQGAGEAAGSEAAAATLENIDDAEREPYPTSFDAIAELIATGRVSEIPGIRDIPVEISDEPPSEAKLTPRPKPWEQQQQSVSSSAPAPSSAASKASAPPPSVPAGFESISESSVLQS